MPEAATWHTQGVSLSLTLPRPPRPNHTSPANNHQLRDAVRVAKSAALVSSTGGVDGTTAPLSASPPTASPLVSVLRKVRHSLDEG